MANLVQQLYTSKKYDHVIAVIEGALLAGQVQPWMYDVLALTMELAGRPKADVERALLSRIDFAAADVQSTLFSAAYLTRFGAKGPALRLYRQAASLEPTRPEAYVLGLRVARDIKDYAAVQWAATGILQAAWTKDHEQLHREAEDAALDAERALRAAGKTGEADALNSAMAAARVRDLSIHLEWAGDGDLDLSVEEPPGTICSSQDPQTRAGGVHMNDGYGPDPKNCHEDYVCALAVPGVYVVRVQCVDGTVVGKRAQLTVVRNKGGKDESIESFVLRLDKDRAAVRIPLPGGRRKQLAPQLPAAGKTSLLEQLIPLLSGRPVRQVPWSALPASIAPGIGRANAAVRQVGAAGAGNVPFVGGAAAVGGPGLAVGIEPVVVTIPEGATMTAAAVVSNDLRFVRLAVNPNFSTITDVFTFTFVGGGR